MIITVITMYRGHDAEMFTTVVNGQLTPEDRAAWRKAHSCDQPEDEGDEDLSNMFFKEIDSADFAEPAKPAELKNVDGESYADIDT